MKFDRFEDYNVGSGMTPERVVGAPIESSKQQAARRLHEFMVRLRRCQLALIQEYHPADEMKCPMHFCLGQEAAPAALSLALKREDFLFCHHRTHGHWLAKANSMKPLFAEFYGRAAGADGGKAGSQDISDVSANFFSGAILAGSLPLAAGAAVALQFKGGGRVSVSVTGDGASDEGVFWESLNYAALKQLPAIFICENNRYSTYAPQENRSRLSNIAERAAAFGLATKAIFGNDALAVFDATAEAVERARSGGGPTFLETFTYRWNGHVGPEDDDYVGYRTVEEREHWKRLCPLELLEKRMMAAGLLDAAGRARVEQAADAEIREAFELAKRSVPPSPMEWEGANASKASPLADKLLAEEIDVSFDQNQPELVPGPY